MAILAASLSACASPGLFGRALGHKDDPREAYAAQHARTQGVGAYLDLMRQLIEGDPVTQAETFRSIAQAAAASPTTSNRIKLALALGTPGHPGSDPKKAANMFNDLLASGSALLPEERALVTVHLKEVEQQLILSQETEQLKKQAAEKLAAQNAQSSRRLENAKAENEKLRKQLDEAEKKLNAITNIERSIRERENGANTN